jgi:hypothetical protein
MPLDLSAPKVITFSVAVLIALIAAIIHYAHLSCFLGGLLRRDRSNQREQRYERYGCFRSQMHGSHWITPSKLWTNKGV